MFVFLLSRSNKILVSIVVLNLTFFFFFYSVIRYRYQFIHVYVMYVCNVCFVFCFSHVGFYIYVMYIQIKSSYCLYKNNLYVPVVYTSVISTFFFFFFLCLIYFPCYWCRSVMKNKRESLCLKEKKKFNWQMEYTKPNIHFIFALCLILL